MSFSPELHAAPKVDGYRIDAFLGKGATSLVYRAFDIEANFPVALKSIRYPDQDGIYRLKQEFRSFCDFSHPHIVELYKLHVEDHACFYTMELVDGLDFVSFARRRPASLRDAFGQLVDGLAAVHSAGKLHRDLKPANIMVEPTGRTVLLDFGLSVEARPRDSVLTQAQLFGGTPAYMAPEQLDGAAASAATDLYALGVLLYESLAGRRPFAELSPLARHLAAKAAPPSPASLDPEAPDDLSELALALMAFEPDARPSLADVQRLLQEARPFAAPARADAPQGRAAAFVNRAVELDALKGSFEDTLAGRRSVVQVFGVSGAGKSSLIDRFLAWARDQHAALALRSRCDHREAVRYNAVDGLIDMLSRHLIGESEERLESLAPASLPALATVFPVLGRIAWPRAAMDDEPFLADPQALLKQAVDALGQLLSRLAAGRPLVLWIDDLQWSDEGSLPLLARVLRAGAGPILTILSYRSEDVTPEAIEASVESRESFGEQIAVDRLFVGPLASDHVAELIRAATGERAGLDAVRLDAALQASAGLPFFVLEYAAATGEREAGGDAAIPSGANWFVARRLAALTTAQRAILEIVATAGRPIADTSVIRLGAGDGASGREIYRLLNQNLLRKGEADGASALETYHDRIRAAVLETMPAETVRARHLAIAEELERAPEADHPLLVEHFLAAGETARAFDHAMLAARAARRRLAFPQAVDFLRLAVRLGDPLAEGGALLAELAGALADSGRSSEAADLYLRAADAARDDRRAASEFEALAARQLLFSGRLSESRAWHRKLFTDLGVAFPDSVSAAVRMSIVNRLAFAIGLSGLRGTRAKAASEAEMGRLDSLWAAAIGFLMLDFVVGDAVLTRFMRETARVGEPSRLLRATALEASAMANLGQRWAMRRAEKLLARSASLAAKSTDPYDRVVLLNCQMSVVWQRGRWREAAELARQAAETHRRECVRYDFVVSIANSYRLAALAMAGEIRALKADAQEGMEDARVRGDVYVSRSFRSGYYVYAALADDNPEGAIADSEALLQDLPTDRFTSLHWLHFIATTNAHVYAGEPAKAWALIEKQWPLIRAAGFLNLGCIGAHLMEIRARAALSLARNGGDRAPLLKAAAAHAEAIARRPFLSHAAATAAALRSAIAGLNGDAAAVARELAAAQQGFEAADMSMHAAACALRLGGAPPSYFEQEGVRRPERLAAFLTFGLWG